ncbi:MAG: UDP-N-acetylpyruvoylglucosamine reductase [Candidatus Saccharibacteria bacterium]|nr:UDP-N-acetylpyruvoylglucosamine reductase [Candidatus Saccharibacteria bacterium]
MKFMLQIAENVSLSQYSTMRLGGTARYLCSVQTRSEVAEAVAWAITHQTPPIMIGTGSNIIWKDEGFDGLIIVNNIMGYEDFAEDETNHYLTIGAGETWDSVVARSVQSGLTGIEALSLVPGTAGATPIQNVGAYGQDISQTLVSVEAFDLTTQSFLTLPASDCNFSYRASRFNREDRGRFLITGITLHLMKQNPLPPFYGALEKYFTEHSITQYGPAVVRNAVIDIRSHKLPDPATTANCGSFFANPIIDQDALLDLQVAYPDIPHWPTDDPEKVKIPAAWLLESAGFKDFRDEATGMATWPAQPLVLVNEKARTVADLLAFKARIVETVKEKFSIELVQEPELLP